MKKIYISSFSKSTDDYYSFNLKSDLSALGYEIVNKDTNPFSYNDERRVTPEFLISQSDVFIAIIKEKSPFVFYELGYAAALGKKVLIICDSEFDLPESLRNYNYARFDSTLSNTLYTVINFLQRTTIEENSLKENISTLKDFIQQTKLNPQIIDRVSGAELEELVYNYFVGIGANVERPKSTAEHYGFDLMLYQWEGHKKTLIEVKKYNKNSKVSVNTIQQVVGAINIYNASHAVIITTSEFTASALEYAKIIDRRIELWDINTLSSKVG